MEQLRSSSAARNVGVLVTNGGTHSAATWAQATADRLIYIGPALPPQRIETALKIKARVVDILGEAFDKVRAVAGREKVDVAQISRDIIGEMRRLMTGTPWASKMESLDLCQLMTEEVARSLKTIVQDERASER